MDASQPNNHGFARETAAGPQQGLVYLPDVIPAVMVLNAHAS